MRENGVFVFGSAGTVFGQLFAQFLHLGDSGRVDPIGGVLLFFFFQLTGNLLSLSFITAAKCCLNLFRQALLQVLINLIGTSIEDSIDTKI